jgi:enterochelin esterase family protein
VYLQDGKNDLDNDHGNWFLGNQQMDLAFKHANRRADERAAKAKDVGKADSQGDAKAAAPGPRYDFQFVVTEGGHNGKDGGAILPDTLRWVWRDHKTAAATP